MESPRRGKSRRWARLLEGPRVFALGGMGAGGNCGCCATPTTCAGCFIGGQNTHTLSVTDSNTTFNCTWTGSQWRGSYLISLSCVTSVAGAPTCFGYTTGVASVRITYIITCSDSSGAVKINVGRTWSRIFATGGAIDCSGSTACGNALYIADSINTPGLCCSGPSALPTSEAGVSGFLAPSACNPLVWTGTPTPGAGNCLVPVTGSVVVTG